ncbi:MAG TPA: DinB family protein [Methylomirabilota bacterium]|nr:DinB family protein [Methylomirabilota bacterium]
MSAAMIRDLYDYHHWANRTLFEVAGALGAEACARDMGRHFSFPTLTRMFGHVYGADFIWLSRWKGASPTTLPGAEFTTMEMVRGTWDGLEAEQKAFVDGLKDADLARVVEYKNTEGKAFAVPLGPLLQHVPNHATHHRSELATMITLIKGSPPDTGMNTWVLTRMGQTR